MLEINVDGLEHSDVDVKNLFGHGGNVAEAHISEDEFIQWWMKLKTLY